MFIIYTIKITSLQFNISSNCYFNVFIEWMSSNEYISKYILRPLVISAADQSKVMQEQMSGAAMAMPPDPKAAFKAEWEALEITDHRWALATAETDLLIKSSIS